MKKIDLSLLPEKMVDRLLEKGINLSDINSDEKVLSDGSTIMNTISEKCPFHQCDGSGWLYLRKPDGNEFARYCDCAANMKIQRLIKSAKVPLDYEGATVNSFDINIYKQDIDRNLASIAKRVCINYVKEFERFKSEGKGLYFYSELRGVGKTRLAISLLNALIKQAKIEGFYITTKNLFDELRASFNEGTTQTILNKFMSVPLLILDDLGVEKTSEWTESTFTQILDTRMNQKLVTIITSNLTQDQLDEVYPNGRVSSRIKKMTLPIQMPNEDIRAKLAKIVNDEIIRDLLNIS